MRACIHTYRSCTPGNNALFSVYYFIYSALSFDAPTDVPVHETSFCHMAVENY